MSSPFEGVPKKVKDALETAGLDRRSLISGAISGAVVLGGEKLLHKKQPADSSPDWVNPDDQQNPSSGGAEVKEVMLPSEARKILDEEKMLRHDIAMLIPDAKDWVAATDVATSELNTTEDNYAANSAANRYPNLRDIAIALASLRNELETFASHESGFLDAMQDFDESSARQHLTALKSDFEGIKKAFAAASAVPGVRDYVEEKGKHWTKA